MLDEFDAEAALARLLLPETPVLLDTTLEQLLHEADVCPHQPADTQSNIQQEQTPQELHQLQELNAKFARTVKFLEERREPRVQHAVLVLCQADQACCPPHSSGGVFANPKAVKEAMDKFDQSTQTCSHVTQHGQTGGKIRYVCQSVCAKGQLCKQNPASCDFATAKKVGPATGKCGLQDRCPFKVIFSTERKKGGKQSGGDQYSIAHGGSIFDHSATCSALGAPSKQMSKSMVYNSAAAKSMLSVCKNINAREIIQAVQAEQGAAAGPARTARRWVKDMAQDKSMIDPECAVEHDYHFLQAFVRAFETLNPDSIARIFTTEVNNEECFDGFCLCFKPQIVRIVRACIRAFTLDACFIKHEQNKLKVFALYTLCSMDSNANQSVLLIVCISALGSA